MLPDEVIAEAQRRAAELLSNPELAIDDASRLRKLIFDDKRMLDHGGLTLSDRPFIAESG
jgi:hypothetical protein